MKSAGTYVLRSLVHSVCRLGKSPDCIICKLKVHVVHLEGSDKLLILKLDAGGEKRQVVSGIAKQYSPEEMIGKKVILITNLQSAVLRGVTSEGMILAATKGKKLVLLTVDGDIPAGAKIS